MGDISVRKSLRLTRQELRRGWSFRQTDSSADVWYPVQKIPSVVHLDLMPNNLIPDPFIGMNELKTEWVGEKSWTYKTNFDAPSVPSGAKCVLVFDGLDTFATVKVNGKVLLQSENMFLIYRVDVTESIISGQNSLEIDFDSALIRGRELEKAHPEYRFIAHNGETGRLGVRKAQYHWGWDWGPVLMTAGPWRPVHLEIYDSRVADLWSQIEVSKDLRTASGKLYARIDGPSNKVAFTVKLREKIISQHETAVRADGLAEVSISIENPELWYPHGYGAQTVYEITVDVFTHEFLVDTMSKRTGLRRGELIQEDDEIGQSFYFRINGIDIFCAGSCWIPADNFIPRLDAGKYKKWLQTMIDGNQVMTRVWGGGIYEEDVFYDLCDELGILVWQDFMFGCGSYPTWPELLDSIRDEAVCNVRRLRHHPSIVIYAGNNEDYQIQELYKLDYDYADKDPESWLKSTYPARYISEHLLPKVIKNESPNIPYWPSSPFSGGKDTSDKTIGDLHQWNVWHGTQEKYQIFDDLGGRFNSEFGMEAFPHMQTIQHFVEDPSELYPQSRTLDFHNKADGHERRIATYLVENFRTTTDLAAYIHLTQLAQCEALMFAYRGWRRQWGQARKCGGALVWQLNDCWPVTSWAIIDFFLRKKPAYYAMSRVLRPIAVGVRRKHHDWSVCHARPAKTLPWELWVVNCKTTEVVAEVELRFISISTGEDIKEKITKEIKVAANGSTDIANGMIDNLTEEPHVLAARIRIDGVCVSRDMDWPQPLKYLSFEDRGVSVTQHGDELRVSAKRPTKGLTFEEREGVLISDSAIDIAPGDEQVVTCRGLEAGEKPLSWTYLGQHD